MKLVDTHCHLDLSDYKDDMDAVLNRASDAGVVAVISPGTDIKSSERSVELAHEYPMIFSAVGIHPHEADNITDDDINSIRRLAIKSEKVVAIGEIGLDYCKMHSTKENQQDVFKKMLILAQELDLPVILHNRDADEDFIRILKESNVFGLKGVVHCYSSDKDLLKELSALGLYVSFTGTLTFKNADSLRETAKEIPVEKILLETDGPYMSPVPFRGKRNEPAFVKELLGVYAGMHALSEKDIARITTYNADSLFHLGIKTEGAIVYEIRDSLYLNLTNRCSNRCGFCTRDMSDFVKGHNLRLDKEPEADEVITAIGDVADYKELVFCGYGEPTIRLDVVKKVAKYIKDHGGHVRMITNGEGDLINGRRIAPELKGLIDGVSVSLNSPEAEKYDNICHSVFGKKAHETIIEFIRDCVSEGIEVEVTCLDMIGEEDIARVREIVENIGGRFRLRHLDVVG